MIDGFFLEARKEIPLPRMAENLDIKLEEGVPTPRGATWDGQGTNFAIFSANATKVDLCLFDVEGKNEIARLELPEYTDQVFHGYLRNDRTDFLYQGE